MPGVRLPDDPDLDQLRRQAKELRDAVRAGRPEALTLVAKHDPIPRVPPADFPLHRAQLVLARGYGFASWARLKHYCELVRQHSRTPDTVPESPDPATEFLRLACLTYGADSTQRRAQARALLARHPDLGREHLHVAAATADAAAVTALLDADPASVDAPGGPFGWTPLLYLAYARYDPDLTERATLDTARVLLAHGADPNAGFLWHGLPTPFTVLAGVFGEGEAGPDGQPAHPYATALAELLLAAGADPNDGQVLYNRQFSTDDSHLELLLRHGLGRGTGGPWHRRLGEVLETPAQMIANLLWWAVTHDQRARVQLLADGGADLTSPVRDGATPAQLAALYGHREITDALRTAGVPPAVLDPPDALVAAVFAGDATAAAAFPEAVRERARARRPGLPVWAAGERRGAAVRLLLELGWPVDARGRGDAPIEQEWETALHQAAGNGDETLVAALLAAGADRSLTDQRFASTALGWAEHFGHAGVAGLLASTGDDQEGERP